MRALVTEYQKSFEVDILIFSWASLSMASFSEAPEGALRFIMTRVATKVGFHNFAKYEIS